MKEKQARSPIIIMAAPNGARKTRQDHPNMPVNIEQTVAEAGACYASGATVLHAHVRDDQGQHTLSDSRYKRLLDALTQTAPNMMVQMTTEAVGIYSPDQQAHSVDAVRPRMTSVALREMASGPDSEDYAQGFYARCQRDRIHVQHILYDATDVDRFFDLRSSGVIPPEHRCMLFVLGRYTADQQSSPQDLHPFLQTLESRSDGGDIDWFVCAFGRQEQACMLEAARFGGHARVGFENNLHRPDGQVAESTAELVSLLATELEDAGYSLASSKETESILFE